MTLEDLGYTPKLEEYRIAKKITELSVARVITEHKERYIVKNNVGEFEGELIGNLRFSATDRTDFPAVGDWVAIATYDKNKALIHHIFPRTSAIERQAVGKHGQKQLIATNIDVGFIVQAINRDFSLNRLERYLTICHTSKVSPIIILTKIDLLPNDQLKTVLVRISNRIKDIKIIAISNKTTEGIELVQSIIEKGKTYCLLGSSGVGKSSLLNSISGEELMRTGAISTSIDRGKHVTTHRELIVLDGGGILIDNPGMREVGITESSEGIEMTFEEIATLGENCRYSNCSHVQENGCAILAAVENGIIDSEAYSNYLKMQREKQFFESTIQEKRSKDKAFGKMIRENKKMRNRNKF